MGEVFKLIHKRTLMIFVCSNGNLFNSLISTCMGSYLGLACALNLYDYQNEQTRCLRVQFDKNKIKHHY